MSEEQWRSVVGYDLYEVSDLGRVRSKRGPRRILKAQPTRDGYLVLNLSQKGTVTKRRIHQLVLEAFVGPREEGQEACHGDGRRSNNRLSNLRWDTHLANMADRDRLNPHYLTLRTHCPWGHLLREPNLTRSGIRRGKRECMACTRARGVIRVRGGDHQQLSDEYYAKFSG
ncbi:NUMOD4 motif-containing HNH endonuclease [Microbacterium sp. NPDC088619]|uniref:NUMOD4 motif-containing HNH endonuclease n=1 Tax=Microbacterium sp. NPDC088619 TaxID=3364196 RepID=UPI003803602F